MPLDQLWAPWRLNYIVTTGAQPAEGCFLCRYRDEAEDAKNLVVLRTERSFAVLNRYPYNNGHLLIAPLAHEGDIERLDAMQLSDMMQLLTRMLPAYRRVLSPEGYNVGLNLGRVAGAGVPGHLHWHLVPRWSGDSNFMTVVADTNVIPQSLAALYDLLRAALAEAPRA